MKFTSVALAASLSYMLLPLAAARPSYIRREDIYDPEAPGFERNGPLPDDVEQIHGLAINATNYPETVERALHGEYVTSDDVRIASPDELSEHLFYTKLSAASYCRDVIPGDKFECKNCDQSLKLIKTFTTKIEDTNAMILRGDEQKSIYVVFRGSNSIRNAILDAQIWQTDYPVVPGTKVHRGFLESYEAVRDEVVATLNEQAEQYPDYKVVLTGHSLGAAQALLCGMDLFNMEGGRYGADRLSIYTQGQPRVGDPAFANYVVRTNVPLKRLVNQRDIFAHFPLGPRIYQHPGEEFWITDNDAIQVCPNGIETKDCSNSIVPFTSFLDHLTYLGINTGLCL